LEAVEVLVANGVEIAYRRSGDGPLLLLAHAAASDGRMWAPQIEALADEFTVVAWDEPGAGRSGEVPPGFGLSDYAGCLAALISALDLGPAHVAGLSWGGTVALELYRQRADLVATLVVADSYAGWKGSLPEAEVRARMDGVAEALAAGQERFDPTVPGLFAREPAVELLTLLDAIAADVRMRSMETAASAMAAADLRDVLGTISVPTLLIWGDQDARSPLTVARQFEQSIRDAELVVIPGAGHLSNLEQPGAFNEAVRAFCHARARS
jgi:pimeloyl-ACP methyl ester carboxylesterase